MKQGLTPEFNRLSTFDRLKLKSSAMVIAMGGLMKDDTRATPWMFPFYAAYVAIVVLPIPIPGIHIVPVLALYGWAHMGLTPWARKVKEHFRDSFNEAAVMKEHEHCLEEDPVADGQFRVKNVPLARHAVKRVGGDAKEATLYFWQRCKEYFGPD